jgi:hypothetical protein
MAERNAPAPRSPLGVRYYQLIHLRSAPGLELKNLQNNIVLWLQANTGLSVGFVISLAVAGSAVLVMFIFLCVTGYVWVSIRLGPVFGGLAMAGSLLLIAVVGAAASTIARAKARQRAIMERAARPQGIGALINPKALNFAMQAGRALGWQRLVPLTLLGFLAAQWVKEARRPEDSPIGPFDLFTRVPPPAGTHAFHARCSIASQQTIGGTRYPFRSLSCWM